MRNEKKRKNPLANVHCRLNTFLLSEFNSSQFKIDELRFIISYHLNKTEFFSFENYFFGRFLFIAFKNSLLVFNFSLKLKCK